LEWRRCSGLRGWLELRLGWLGRLGACADERQWFVRLLDLLRGLRSSRIAVRLDAYTVGGGRQDEAAAVPL
jgi:hypothetical protein